MSKRESAVITRLKLTYCLHRRSHLMGFFYRTLRMIDHGMKPMYVFDGKPPDLKKQVVSEA